MPEKVLVIDDESDVLLIVKTALQQEGFEVFTAASGPEGIEAAHDKKPDCIILDFMMPGMDGFEVLRNLRADDDTCMIPVVMLTGVSEQSNIRQAIASGIDFYLVKPFDITDLTHKIRLALKKD